MMSSSLHHTDDDEHENMNQQPLHRVPSHSKSVESEYYEAHSQISSIDDHHRTKLTPAQSQRLMNLNSPPWLTRFRQRCGDVVNNLYVQLGIIALIVINAIMMGLGTFSFAKDNARVNSAFETTDTVFLSIFTVELAMQFIYRGFKLFLDGWLVFDFVVIVLSWGFNSVQVIRAFRIFRGFRLVTRIKVLRDLVTAIGAVLPRMAAIGFLLCLVFYIFAVLFTTLFKNLPLEGDSFRSLDVSLFTCFEMMTLEWSDLAREVMSYESWAWIPFLCFIAISGFIFFNLIIAVVCDAVGLADAESRKMDPNREETAEEKLIVAQLRIKTLTARIKEIQETQEVMQAMLEKLAQQVGAPINEGEEEALNGSPSR